MHRKLEVRLLYALITIVVSVSFVVLDASAAKAQPAPPEELTSQQANLTSICNLPDGSHIWRVTNGGVEGLRFWTSRNSGPGTEADPVSPPEGYSYFRTIDRVGRTLTFSAPGFTDTARPKEANNLPCQGTLTLDKIVEGDGPAGPYTVEIREGETVVRTVELSALPRTTFDDLPAGFVTDDYEGFGSEDFESDFVRTYTVEEVGTQGAAEVLYDPGQVVTFNRHGDQATVTITNVFGGIGCADFAVRIKAPSRVKVGQKFPYTVTARNLGPVDVPDAVLTSRLPRSVKFVRASAGCRYDRASNRVTCALGDMPVGSKEQRRIVVKAQKPGSVRLQGCAVQSGTPECDPSNNQLRLTGGARSPSGDEPRAPSGVGPVTTVVAAESPGGSS